MKKTLCRSTQFILGLAVLAAPLFATTVRKMELPQLISVSDHIVQGRVESVQSREEGNRIFTYISVIVDESIKGDRRPTLLIRQLGGRVGQQISLIAGMPQFRVGEEVILFLKIRQDTAFDVVGMNQGKYQIVSNLAVTNLSGVNFVDSKTGLISDGGFVARTPVETLKAKIRELMR